MHSLSALAASWPNSGMHRSGILLSVLPDCGIAESGTQWLCTPPPSVGHDASTRLVPRFFPYVAPDPRPPPLPVQYSTPSPATPGPGDTQATDVQLHTFQVWCWIAAVLVSMLLRRGSHGVGAAQPQLTCAIC